MAPYKAASHVCICEVHFHGKDGEIRRDISKKFEDIIQQCLHTSLS